MRLEKIQTLNSICSEYKASSVQVQAIMLIFIDKYDFVFDEWGLSTSRAAGCFEPSINTHHTQCVTFHPNTNMNNWNPVRIYKWIIVVTETSVTKGTETIAIYKLNLP
jgi:hypothetical protein